jgi:hypothetical protein
VKAPTSGNAWSEKLQGQTRHAIEGSGVLAMRNDRLYLKHEAWRFGTIAADDMQRGVLRIVDMWTNHETTFASADELIMAGWVLD